MKRLLTLGAILIAASAAHAQLPVKKTIVQQITEQESFGKPLANLEAYRSTVRNNSQAGKGTTGPQAGYYSYVDANFITGTSTGYFYQIYQDSSVRSPSTTNPNQTLGLFGMGNSFDPTSLFYLHQDFSGLASNPDGASNFYIDTSKPYTIDSMFFSMKYMRKPYNNYVDTLVVDIVRTGVPLTYQLIFGASATGFNINSFDSSARFADAKYEPTTNTLSDSISAGARYRYVLPLDNAFFADSTAGGIHPIGFAIPGGLAVPAREKVVSYVSFRSGFTYPANTLIDSVNHIRLFAFEPFGANTFIRQFGDDYTSFLWATKQSKYAAPFGPYSGFDFEGRNILIPSSAYEDPTGFGIQDVTYYVRCANCLTAEEYQELVGIKEQQPIVVGNAYPNPASSQVSVPFQLRRAGKVVATLSTPTGQVLQNLNLGTMAAGQTSQASFNTASLPSGLYMATIEVNGVRTTSRISVIR